MSDSPTSPKRGLFQTLSKRAREYRSKKRAEQPPSSPKSQLSETESQRSGDELEVQVSGKSARSSRRFASTRQGLTHLSSAPAGALQAAAEQAVADHLADSTHPKTAGDWSFSSLAISPQKSTPRFNRSQSHMDVPRQGSTAVAAEVVPLAMDSMASSSSSGGIMPAFSRHSISSQHVSPVVSSQKALMSPAAAPTVQQNAPQPTPIHSPAQQGKALSEGRQLSRKISGNKLILSTGQHMEAKNGEILLAPQAAPYAGRGGFESLEICFSGKSARMSRGALRHQDSHTVAAH